MYSYYNVESIRILPSDKETFNTEDDFKFFIEKTMSQRGGLYYFPKSMMKCPHNTLVLFQYDGMIRAIGILIDFNKEKIFDERGIEYSGYYKFDIGTLHYLDNPINKKMMKSVYPLFSSFNQSKQIIPLEYYYDIVKLVETVDSYLGYEKYKAKINNLSDELEKSNLDEDSKSAIVKLRINQDIFRDRLLKRYDKCCLCGVSNKSLLIASHIKPWSKSTTEEKLDVDNGFLMCPNHDKLFDKGWITFDLEGNIVISDILNDTNRSFMNIHNDMKITLTEKNKKYLEYHRKNIFFKDKVDVF